MVSSLDDLDKVKESKKEVVIPMISENKWREEDIREGPGGMPSFYELF